MKWNDKQKEAIETRDKNILVAAAAGSGKTAVLIERIIRLVLDDKASIDRMLIVTFTRAATTEMKAKIRAGIKKAIETTDNRDERKILQHQLELLPSASISTFHVFAMSIIRQFFHMIPDLEPGFRVEDDLKIQLLKEQVFEEMIDDRFEHSGDEGEAFSKFLDSYTDGRNFQRLGEQVMEMHQQLRNIPHYREQAHRLVDNLINFADEKAINDWEPMVLLWEDIKSGLERSLNRYEALCQLANNAGLPRLASVVVETRRDFCRLALEKAKAKDYDGIVQMGNLPRWNFRVAVKTRPEEAELYKGVRGEVDELRSEGDEAYKDVRKLMGLSTKDEWLTLAQRIEEMAEVYYPTKYFVDMVLDFDDRFQRAKFKAGSIDYGDMEHKAIELLENTEVADFYKEKFEHIFIDEYQDTNLLQEWVISHITSGNNLFMVGDVKQSIYKFRSAEPEIFMRKYAEYEADKINAVKIDLNTNYRSKAPILDFVNDTFNEIMAGYDENARLYLGAAQKEDRLYKPKLYLIDAEDKSEIDKELKELKNSELEGVLIGDIIKEHIGEPIYDSRLERERPLEARDIVILSSKMKNFGVAISRILNNMGIGVHISGKEGYFNAIEIRIFLNLLKTIENRLQDVELISVLHSEIFGFTIEELAIIRGYGDKRDYFYNNLKAYLKSEGEDTIKKKIESTLEHIERWKRQADTTDLSGYIWELLQETGYYVLVGAMYNGETRQGNLRGLVDKAVAFEGYGQTTLSGFIDYMTQIETSRSLTMGEADIVGEADNVVRMMTIHKSKGLEFPMVILAGYNNGETGAESRLDFHKDVGIALDKVSGRTVKHTLMSDLIKRKTRKEEDEEQQRKLYVALTRPTDILVATGVLTGRGATGSFYNKIGWKGDCTIVSTDALTMQGSDNRRRNISIGNSDFYDGELSREEQEVIRNRLDFKYPYLSAKEHRPKYTVTKLNNIESVPKEGRSYTYVRKELISNIGRQLTKPKFMAEDGKVSVARIGTMYHSIMERIDFQRYETDGRGYLQMLTRELMDQGLASSKEIEKLNLDKIEALLRNNLGKRIIKAAETGVLRREQPFVHNMDIGGEETLVQGTIDCYFIERDENGESYIVLVDYKNSRFNKKQRVEENRRLIERYKEQMRLYKVTLEAAYDLPVKEAYLYLFQAEEALDVVL